MPYTVATDMDSPNPDSGEEYYHTNTQLYNTLDEHNRFKIGEAVAAPWNAPPPGAVPTMDGFVTDYISRLHRREFTAYRSATSETGPNVWNTPLLIGWDEPGGTYDHVPPGPVPPPDPTAPPGELGFTFDRSGYWVPAIIVSPWVEPGSVYSEEYSHTSLIATLRKAWGLGVHPARCRGSHVRPGLLARHGPATRRHGRPSQRVRCPSGRWTSRWSARH